MIKIFWLPVYGFSVSVYIYSNFSSFRYSRFDKAFLLAVDIGARDLFMVSKTLNSH